MLRATFSAQLARSFCLFVQAFSRKNGPGLRCHCGSGWHAARGAVLLFPSIFPSIQAHPFHAIAAIFSALDARRPVPVPTRRDTFSAGPDRNWTISERTTWLRFGREKRKPYLARQLRGLVASPEIAICTD